MTDAILFTQERHIGFVTLQRPQALNALTLEMILALHQQLKAWQDDETIHAVVIQAMPGRAFCAGGDVRSLYEGRAHRAQQMQFFWHEYHLNHDIHGFKKPYIALMDGVTMGGGVGISLHGSHPVASERFLFAMPETGIGFFPDIGASYLLTRCPGFYGEYLGLTGSRLNAAEARALNLVKYIISAEQFSAVSERLVNTDLSHQAHERVSACLQSFMLPEDSHALSFNDFLHQHAYHDEVQDYFQAPSIEVLMERLALSQEVWQQKTYQDLLKKSPLSLKVTLSQLRKARSLSLAECLELDYCLANHFMNDPDFYEGVRALLVDKDNAPQWQPATIADVSEAQVANYFECVSEQALVLS